MISTPFDQLRMLAILFSLATTAAFANEAAPDDGDGTRSPGDMTVEERSQMMREANAYNTCVYEKAMAGVDAEADIRRVADLAMNVCETHLDALGSLITGWGMPAGFAEGFTRTVRDRAVHRLIPELAIRKAR